MARSFDVVETTLSAEVAASGGTFTVSYPANKNAGNYNMGFDHKITTNAYGDLTVADNDIEVTFGASNITITNNGAFALAAGTKVYVQLDQPGQDDDAAFADLEKISRSNIVTISLGAPDTADADGVCASQAGTADTAMTIAGALASGNVATFDVPRNVVAAWTGTAVLTVTGTDEFGNTVVESSASGTSMAGKKALKTVTSVVPSANITSATVGTGDVLGLPAFLPGAGRVLAELEDGAAATAGTLVAGVRTTPATATTGDVRGTYDPNSAADGSKAFELVVALDDPSDKGVAQYAG